MNFKAHIHLLNIVVPLSTVISRNKKLRSRLSPIPANKECEPEINRKRKTKQLKYTLIHGFQTSIFPVDAQLKVGHIFPTITLLNDDLKCH
ncbi:hypothetical protein Hanom_Chr05g00445691 [Helianthus anomalus]